MKDSRIIPCKGHHRATLLNPCLSVSIRGSNFWIRVYMNWYKPEPVERLALKPISENALRATRSTRDNTDSHLELVLSRIQKLEPRMDTDKHGFRRVARW